VRLIYTYFRLIAAALAVAIVPAITHVAPAFAQSQQPEIVVGVVDFDLIMNESKAGKSVKSQYDQRKTDFDNDYEQKRKQFKGEERKLADQRSTLSEDEFKKKVEELDAKGKSFEKSLSQTKQKLDSNLKKAVGQIRSTLLDIVADIAKKRALTLVLNKSDVVLAADAYDFTDEAMKQLDAKLPSVKLAGAN
jgi:Skp family chaperone for outer membrane proteins